MSKGGRTREACRTARPGAARQPLVERVASRASGHTPGMRAADDSLLPIYADWLHFSVAKAKRTRDDFYPWEALDPDRILGLEASAADAVAFRYLSAPLTAGQLAELVQRLPP